MIIKVAYGKKTEEAMGKGVPALKDDMIVSSQIIDCTRIYPMESETHWGFMAYDAQGTLIADHKFDIEDNTKVYITDKGKTVDVLPRR